MTTIPVETECVELEGIGACTVEDIKVTVERPDGGRFRVTGTMLRQMIDGEVSWLADIDGMPIDPEHPWNGGG